MSIGAVVLAAGQGSRYHAAGGVAPSKLVADLAGQAVVRHVARAALASQASPVIVVTGYARDHVMAALSGLDVTFCHNALYAEGMAGSLQVGLASLPDSIAGAVILLGDMPDVGPDLIDGLGNAFLEVPLYDAVVPLRYGRRGNPVLLGRSLFPAVGRLGGDVGARHLLSSPSTRVREIAVETDAIARDIDTPSDLELH